MDIIRETINNVVSVLLEGRLEDVKAKYSNVKSMEAVIDNMSQGDPSGNNKYLDWMASVYQADPDTSAILKAVNSYHEGLPRLSSDFSTPIVDANKGQFPGRAERRAKNNPKDIGSFPSLSALNLIVTALEETKKIRPDRDSIYQDNQWTVIVPKTHEAACKYGVHSNWCVSTSNSDYFKQYTEEKDALLFFIIWRNKRDVSEKTEYKIAINAKYKNWEDPKVWDWYDMPDQEQDPNLMLNIFPKDMIEKVQRYLVVEGKKKGKIIDEADLMKLINDNSTYKYGEQSGHIYFGSDNMEAFSGLENFKYALKWARPIGEFNSINSVIYIEKSSGKFNYTDVNIDLWDTEDDEVPALGAYKQWRRFYTDRGFANYIMGLPGELTIPEELKTRIETKVKEGLAIVGGMWLQTRSTGLRVGDKVRWKKGRGYWDQRRNSWNESTIDRQTPAGFFVTGKTNEFPKGKRFKPNYNTSMDVYHEFGGDIDLSANVD